MPRRGRLAAGTATWFGRARGAWRRSGRRTSRGIEDRVGALGQRDPDEGDQEEGEDHPEADHRRAVPAEGPPDEASRRVPVGRDGAARSQADPRIDQHVEEVREERADQREERPR